MLDILFRMEEKRKVTLVIPTVKNPKILGLTFDPKLTYNSHICKTSDRAKNTLKLLKALTSTKWGK